MNILMISPGYPRVMPKFAQGLAALGVRVFGIGDQHPNALPDAVRPALTAYAQVTELWNERALISEVLTQMRRYDIRIDRVECLWEPALHLAAALRQALRLPGLGPEQTRNFRDKERMKLVLDAAGLRTPWHRRARTAAEVRLAAKTVGFPLIVKPIDGAGSTDTHRIDSTEQLEAVLPTLSHLNQVSIEEFIEGDEYTFDTVCAGGRILYENVAFYRTRPMEEKKHEWVSPSAICLRDLDAPELESGRQLGRAVLKALNFRTGFTHMEWFRKSNGEVVFGEIGARPPGANLVDVMNYASDIDLYHGWAEAICHGKLSQKVERKYNAGIVLKRARGAGPIREIVGLDRLVKEFGPHIAAIHMPHLGDSAGDWRAAAPADGFVILRHPRFDRTLAMVERALTDVQIHAG